MIIKIISAVIALITAISAETPDKRCKPAFNGTFIQSWYCAYWEDEDWQNEIEYMLEAGIKYLIIQDVAYIDKTGECFAYYPSEIEGISNDSSDVIGSALRNLENTDIRVFVGLADFEKWWSSAALTHAYQKTCDIMTKMQSEIYSKYYEQYSENFYGWYFTPEISNNPLCKASITNIVKGLNKILKTRTMLNPDMPVMLSPYYSDYYAVPSVTSALPMWVLFFEKADFSNIDIFAPQDAVGAAWIKESRLETVWKMYRTAVDTCNTDVALWANCECMNVARKKVLLGPPETDFHENMPRSIEDLKKQMDIASRYCDNIITFSYNHYYSPKSGFEGYHEKYLEYISENAL